MSGEFRDEMPRMEVLSMSFQTNNLDRDNDHIIKYLTRRRKPQFRNPFKPYMPPQLTEKDKAYMNWDKLYRITLEKDPSNFKGRIFIVCGHDFHEIYNSDTDSQYTDLAAMRRKSSNEEEYDLPVMGPHSGLGIEYVDQLFVIVHRDSGDATIDESYVPSAPTWLGTGIPLRCDDWGAWDEDIGGVLDERFRYKVDGLFYNLILDCIVYSDSKLVSVVEVKWVMTDEKNSTRDIYICGELSVISSNDIKSLLLNTPPDKAIKVWSGKPIPLLKSVVAIPYNSDFKFRAKLGCPSNVVDSAFYFPTVNDCHCDTPSTSDLNVKFLVPGGYLEVRGTINMQ